MRAVILGIILYYLSGLSALALTPPWNPVSKTIDNTSLARQVSISHYLESCGFVALPLEQGSGNHFQIKVKVNGQEAIFLIDTGAQISVVNRKCLKRLKLSSIKTHARVFGAVGGPGEPVEAALAKNLQLGPCTVTPFLVGVIDLDALTEDSSADKSSPSTGFDGILGADILQNFPFIIDCSKPQLFVWNYAAHGSPKATPLRNIDRFLKSNGYSCVTMKRKSVSGFEVIATVNHQPAVMLIDTGAAVSLLDQKLSKRAGIKSEQTQYSVGGAGGGERAIALGTIYNLRLQSHCVPKFFIAITDISAVAAQLREEGKPALNGYFGADFLNANAALIDCSNMRLYLKN